MPPSSPQPRSVPHRCGALTLLAAVLAICGPARTMEPSATELIKRINEFRVSEPDCAGQPAPTTGPLAPDERLARVQPERGLLSSLKAAGYLAERAQMIRISGPSSAQATMRALAESDCRTLTNSRHAEIGVSRDGDSWTIVLARPLLADDLGDWPQAGRQVLERVNEARSSARRCGDQRFAPAPALRWDAKLAEAAHRHSKHMADDNVFSHRGKDGSKPSDRADRAGYVWRRIGENIASGQGSPDNAVAAWLASPHHCANIMNPRFTEMGAAYALNPASETTIFWTQLFGTPR